MRIHSAVACLVFAAAAAAQSVLPPFNLHYTAVDLGPMPGVSDYGGITFHHADPNVLLVSAYNSGTIVAVQLVRDAQGRITGFGSSSTVATVGGNDGGLAYGPGNVLFFTWYSANQLGQLKPGSTTADKYVDLQQHGIVNAVGTCAFVPAGRAGAGRFKIATYSSSQWFDVALVPDGNGTFDLGTVTMAEQIEGGPEGILYPPATAPLLGDKVLIAEWNQGMFAYQTDANGDPIHATRAPFLQNLAGNAGGAIDPITGDWLFTGIGGVLAAIRGGAACGTIASYGAATPGAGVAPTLTATGCPRLGDQFTMVVQGRPGAFGTFTMGSARANWSVYGVTILTNLDAAITHQLDGQGRLVVPFPIPATAAFGNIHVYFQAGYLEPTGGFSATAGLDVWIR